MEVDHLLQGAYDLHVHTGPDVIERKLNDLEMAKRLKNAEMKGYAIKSHYFCTAERARTVKELYSDVNVVGAISLNRAVGGLNPIAVEMAARDGAKIVWMPTVDAKNEQDQFDPNNKKLPGWAKLQQDLLEHGIKPESLSILENGSIKKSVKEILDIIANHQMILATGHLGKKEIFPLVKAAKDAKVNKIVITHPNFPTINLSKEEQKELSELGAYMEHCFTTPHTGKVSWESTYEQVHHVGAGHCILSTDLGQYNAMYPDEAMKVYMSNMLANGFDENMIRVMTQENPTYLVEG